MRVIDGHIGTPFSAPVLPPPDFRIFDTELRAIHGLKPSYIVGAEQWPRILERIEQFIIGPDGRRLPLVAHNAAFERSVIRQTSAETGVADPGFEYFCTVKLARLVDPGSPNHKLNTLAERYGIEQLHHHDAGDDALVGARLMQHLMTAKSAPRHLRASLLR